MRTTPPFDPRVQPVGMYVGAPPQMYMQPMMHPTTQQPTNFIAIPHMQAPHVGPELMMHGGQHQVPHQQNDRQIKMTKP